MKPAVFLDRDGCVNVEVCYIKHPDQLILYRYSAKAIKKINDAGFYVIIVSNQSGIARGIMTEETVINTNKKLVDLCALEGATIDRIEYCPHHPDGSVTQYSILCTCRKPQPGMVLKASRALSIDLHKSYVIGDKLIDIGLAKSIRSKSILVRTGFGARQELLIPEISAEERPDHVADNLMTAVDWILSVKKK